MSKKTELGKMPEHVEIGIYQAETKDEPSVMSVLTMVMDNGKRKEFVFSPRMLRELAESLADAVKDVNTLVECEGYIITDE